ncbi:MAG: hypothetical protein AMJ61_02030 [Desulfobacterales bacterium SG8_35_2]|nr:MAG: hypothetical protein AMJ61_02030 [Desulfobacterales bacterium SG8_35_2]
MQKKAEIFFSEHVFRNAARRNKPGKTNSYSNLQAGYSMRPGFNVEWGCYFCIEKESDQS